MQNLKGYFHNRGYKNIDIDRGIQKALNTQPQTKKDKEELTTMVITYHPSNPKFAKIMHKVYTEHKDQLPSNFPKPIVAYRRTKNL